MYPFILVPKQSIGSHEVSDSSTFGIEYWGMKLVTAFFKGLFNYSSTAVEATEESLDARSYLSSSKNISQTISDIVDTMTIQIMVGPKSTKLNGTLYIPETYIVVRWPWFILPSSLVLLSIIFFGLTVRRSTRRVPLWRSSVLPYLFHGLEGWAASDVRVNDQAGMNALAKSIEAHLARNEHGDRRLPNMAEPEELHEE